MGPFTIVEKINAVAYMLDLPDNLKWQTCFPCLIAQVIQQWWRVQPQPLYGGPEYHVERGLSHRLVRSHMDLLIKWKGYAQEHNSWEPAGATLENCEQLVSEYWSRSGARSTELACGRKAGRPTQ
eukprot:jgi/Botrbrau1/2093/Bobra.0093s0001.1